MLFFSLKGDIKEPIIFKDVNDNPLVQMHVLPLESEHANEHTIYCGSVFDVRQVAYILNQKYQDQIQIQIFEESVIESAFKLPRKLGIHVDKVGNESQFNFEDYLHDCKQNDIKSQNILFAQSFGNSFTDTYVSGNILRKISEKFLDNGIKVNYEGTLSQGFPQPGMLLNQLHPLNNYFNSIFSVSELMRFDAYWSFSDIEIREGYENSEYFEFFSKQFGLNETVVSNEFYINPISRIQIKNRIRKLKEDFSKISIVQTNGTLQLHKMPDSIGKSMLSELCEKNKNTLFISDNTYELKADNLISLSDVSGNLIHYTLLLENADSVITVSSLTPLLAKELDVPCLFISTMAEANELIDLSNSPFSTISLKEHGFYDTDNLYTQIKEEDLELVWESLSSTDLISKFNELPEKSGKKEFDSNILTGNELLAKLMNPEF